jgi:uncharacterized protein involved in exopolysaccharide biosynthesis
VNQIRTPRDRLDRVLSILWRSRRFFLQAMALLIVGGAISVTYAMLRKRVFKSETLILYREGIRSNDNEEGGDRAHKLGLRLKEMVHSRTRLEAIIGEYKLYPALVEDRGIIEAVDEMRAHISFRVKDGDTFGLSFEGDEPKKVQKVTARLADALIAEHAKGTSDQAAVNKNFLDQELTQTESILRDKELAQAQFLGRHPEFAKEAALQGGGNQAGIAIRAQAAKQLQQGAKPTDPVLASLEHEATRLQERLGMPVTRRKRDDVQGDPTLVANKQDADADVRQMQKDLQQKLAEYTESHPDVIAARMRLKMAQDKLKRASDALSANIAAAQQRTQLKDEDEGTIDRSALEAELRRVNGEIASFKQRKAANQPTPTAVTSSVVDLELEWTRLNREVAKAREDFGTLQDRQFKAAMATTAAASGNSAQMLIVDPAFVPTHAAKPGRSTIAGAGLAVALLLAIALAIGLAMIDDRLYDRVDVERFGLLPLVGVVPRPSKSEKRGTRG